MSSVNKVTLLGNVGKDPECRRMTNGNPVVSFSLATSERWRDKATGERKEKTEWHKVVIFNEHLADIAQQYVSKGSKVYVEGSLQTRKWTDKDKNERYTTEVVLQRFGGSLVLLSGNGSASNDDDASVKADKARFSDDLADLDDEIPF